MAFSTQITDLVGGTIDDTACDQWAADACKEIIHQLPDNLKAKCAAATELDNSPLVMDMDGVGEILFVTRLSADSGGYQIPCREIPSMYGGLAEDSNDLNYFATVTDPVYWIDGNNSDAVTLYVKPTLTSAQKAYVHHISYPTVDVDSVSVIANFPDEAEYLVVLYVAIKQLHQYMNSKRSDLPSDLVVPVLETVSESLPTWSAPDDYVAPVNPAVPSLSAQSVTITGTAPTFVKPVMTTQTAFSSYTSGLSETDPGTFSLNAVAPAVPSLSTTSVSFSQAAPTFTKPVVGLDFAQVNTYIDTNEDIELASSKLQEISAQLNEYSANIQNEQVEFNKESAEYNAQLQISIQNAQFDNQEDARKLQKYQAEVSTYQANIGKEVQQYSTKLSQYQLELTTSYQAWAKAESDNISIYQANIQNETSKFNDENTEYQAKLQKDIQDAGLLDANEARKLQKYQAEVGTYGAEVNTNSQTFTNAITKNKAAFDTSMQKYTSEIQKASSLNASTLQKFQAETADYSAKLQKQGMDYQWYQGQYAALKADYQQGLQQLVGGGGTPPPAQ